jgi:serine/threonine-protein kinase
MRVRHEVWRFTPEGMARAEALLEQADDLVGASPRLIAAKADLLFQTVNLGFSDDESRVDRAEVLAREALALDDRCAQAYSTLAWIRGSRRQSVLESLRLIERAVELDPSDSTAALGLVFIASVMGRRGALDPAEVARELIQRDPLWGPTYIASWMLHMVEGRFDGAFDAARRSWDIEATPAIAVAMALSLLELGRTDEAEQRLEPLTQDRTEVSAWRDLGLALYHGVRGETDQARERITDEVRAWAEPDGQYCWHVAQVHAVLGDHEQVLAWMERAVDNQFWNWRYLTEHERLFDEVSGEPRFEALVERAREALESVPGE